MRIDFRFQKSSNAVYRVGPTVGGIKQTLFTSIQTAISQAVADGHTNNTNPAIIEIYPGTYTENLTLNAGVHLKGVGSYLKGDNLAILIGSMTYSLSSGALADNVCNIQNLVVTPPAATKALTFSGTSAGRINLKEVSLASNSAGAGITGLISVTNSGVGSTCRFFDCLVTGNNTLDDELIQASTAVTEFYGGQGGLANGSGGTIASAVNLTGTATLNVRMQNFGSAAFTRWFRIGAAGAILNIDRTVVQNTLASGIMFDFAAAGQVRARFCGLFLLDAASKIGNGAAGSLVMNHSAFGGLVTAPFAAVDSGLSVNGTGLDFAQKNTSYNEFQVGRGVGYSTIQAAITAAAASAVGLKKVVKIPPGVYSENLTLAENVDLATDTQGFAYDALCPVTIQGVHSIAFTAGGASVNINNIRLQSLATNSTPLFSVSGAASDNTIRIQDCMIKKTFAGSTSLFDINTTGSAFTLVLQDCLSELQSDGGSMIDLAGATDVPKVIINNQQGTLLNRSYAISVFTAGPAVAIPMITCPAANGSDVFIQGICATLFSARTFLLQTAQDSIQVANSIFKPSISDGEGFKFDGAGSASLLNSSFLIFSDGVVTGIPVVARDGGVQASGTFTFNSNPAPADTVVVDGTTITFGVDVTIGATSQDTALNLANFINGLGTTVEAINLIAGSNTVDVKALETGTAGNAITFTSATAAITASGGGTLAGGTDGAGGTFNYGGDAFNNTFIQSSLTAVQYANTLTAI